MTPAVTGTRPNQSTLKHRGETVQEPPPPVEKYWAADGVWVRGGEPVFIKGVALGRSATLW